MLNLRIVLSGLPAPETGLVGSVSAAEEPVKGETGGEQKRTRGVTHYQIWPYEFYGRSTSSYCREECYV
jgi:hypothetical protein